MSGDMLAAEARVLAPGIRIVFATGKGEVNNWPDAVVLRKPYDLDALVAVLAGAVAVSGASDRSHWRQVSAAGC
jgi:hypothetical protein